MNKTCLLAAFCLFAVTAAPAKTVPFDFEVVRADGTPAADVAVYASCTNPRALDAPILAQGRTDKAGKFHATYESPPDREIIGVQALAVSSDNQVGMLLYSALKINAQSAAAKITLGPSAEVKMQILQPDGSPAANLEVWVTDLSGKLVRGERFPRFGSISKLPGDLLKATTDQDGRCVITRIPLDTGIYIRHADSRFAQPYGKYSSYTSAPAKNDGALHKVTLTKPGSLRGRIVDANNVPAANVLVSIIETMPYKTAYGDDVRTQADGTFLLTQIPPSTYKFRFTLYPPLSDEWVCPEHAPAAVREGETSDAGDIRLEPACIVTAEVLDEDTGKKADEPLIFRLPAGRHLLRYRMERFPPKGYHVSGNHLEISVNLKSGEHKTVQFKLQPVKPSDMVTGLVLDPDGKPAANVSVMLTTEHSWAKAEPTKTAADGSFSIMVPAEAKGVSAIAWDGSKSMSDITKAERGQSVTLLLKRDGFARVEGRVIDQSGFPIKGARVQWTDWKLRVSLMENFDHIPGLVPETTDTDADGRFVFPRLWTSLKPFIACTAEGYNREVIKDVKMHPNKTTQLSFTLTEPGHTVKGIVMDGSGHAVEGANIALYGDGQPGHFNNTKTDAQGKFQIGPLVSGRVYVRVFQETPDFSREITEFIKVPSDEVRLVLPAANGTVAGSVLDHAGKPVADADISAGMLHRKTHTDAQGRFELTGLVHGWFDLQASSHNAKDQEIKISQRCKTGSTALVLQLPENLKTPRTRPEEPLNLLGQTAPPLPAKTWIHSAPLTPTPENKVRIIDFWGLQCHPCLAGMPKVAAFWKEHQNEGLEIIGHCTYPAEEVNEFLAKHPDYTFPFSISEDDSPVWRDYDVRGIPTYVVINRAGKIVSHGHDWDAASLAALAELKLKK